jgi:hypothetical protein
MKPTPTKQSIFKVSKGVDHFFKVKNPQYNTQTATDKLGKLETEKFEGFGPLNMQTDESTESNSPNSSPSQSKSGSMVVVQSADNLTSSENSQATDVQSSVTRMESRINDNTVITDF